MAEVVFQRIVSVPIHLSPACSTNCRINTAIILPIEILMTLTASLFSCKVKQSRYASKRKYNKLENIKPTHKGVRLYSRRHPNSEDMRITSNAYRDRYHFLTDGYLKICQCS